MEVNANKTKLLYFCSDQIIDEHTKKSPKFSTTWHFDTLISSMDCRKLEDLDAGNSK